MVDDWGTGIHKIQIGEKQWHWVHLVFESGDSMTFYVDGEKVAKNGAGAKWTKEHDMVLHGIFAHSFGEAIRTCNCSIAIYRVYDRALTQAEISQNVRGIVRGRFCGQTCHHLGQSEAMRKAVSILRFAFFLAGAPTAALADAVPGALLHLDASDNPGHPDAWTNLGAAGGELPAGNRTPILETGTIEIPGLGFTLKNTKFYTCRTIRSDVRRAGRNESRVTPFELDLRSAHEAQRGRAFQGALGVWLCC